MCGGGGGGGGEGSKYGNKTQDKKGSIRPTAASLSAMPSNIYRMPSFEDILHVFHRLTFWAAFPYSPRFYVPVNSSVTEYISRFLFEITH